MNVKEICFSQRVDTYCTSESITRSRSREMKMTRRICFRLAGDTGVADMFIAGG